MHFVFDMAEEMQGLGGIEAKEIVLDLAMCPVVHCWTYHITIELQVTCLPPAAKLQESANPHAGGLICAGNTLSFSVACRGILETRMTTCLACWSLLVVQQKQWNLLSGNSESCWTMTCYKFGSILLAYYR